MLTTLSTMIIQMAPIIAMLVLALQHKHLLMALLALESIMLSTVLIIPLIMLYSYAALNSLCIIILSLGACEASIGLSLMVILSRSFGSDMFKSLSTNKC